MRFYKLTASLLAVVMLLGITVNPAYALTYEEFMGLRNGTLMYEDVQDSGLTLDDYVNIVFGTQTYEEFVTGPKTFRDVPDTHPYAKAINALLANGKKPLRQYIGSDTFNPDTPITNQEAADIMWFAIFGDELDRNSFSTGFEPAYRMSTNNFFAYHKAGIISMFKFVSIEDIIEEANHTLCKNKAATGVYNTAVELIDLNMLSNKSLTLVPEDYGMQKNAILGTMGASKRMDDEVNIEIMRNHADHNKMLIPALEEEAKEQGVAFPDLTPRPCPTITRGEFCDLVYKAGLCDTYWKHGEIKDKAQYINVEDIISYIDNRGHWIQFANDSGYMAAEIQPDLPEGRDKGPIYDVLWAEYTCHHHPYYEKNGLGGVYSPKGLTIEDLAEKVPFWTDKSRYPDNGLSDEVSNRIWNKYKDKVNALFSETVPSTTPVVPPTELHSKAGLASSWAQADVSEAFFANLVPTTIPTYAVSGVPETYSYTLPIQRKDFCELVINLVEAVTEQPIKDYVASKGLTMTNPFEDVVSSVHTDILAAHALGIVNGRTPTHFSVAYTITREEAATMLARTAKVLGIQTGTGIQFKDMNKVSDWAKESVAFISGVVDPKTNNRVMGGTTSTTFGPKGNYTREQAIVTAVRLLHAAQR